MRIATQELMCRGADILIALCGHQFLYWHGFFLLLVIWESQCPQEWLETSLVLSMFRFWRLNPAKVSSMQNSWDIAISSASEEYKHRMHNLCCDNCHSHVAMALNLMQYNRSSSWNMVKLCFFMLIYGKFTSLGGFLKTWVPFTVIAVGIILLIILLWSFFHFPGVHQ